MDESQAPVTSAAVSGSQPSAIDTYPQMIYWPRLVLFVFLSLTTIAFTGRLFWWADILGQPRLHYMLVLIVLAFFFLLAQQTRLALMAGAGVMLNVAAIVTSMPTITQTAKYSGETYPPGELTVVSYNVNVGNPTPENLVTWLHEVKPDIAMLIEANRAWKPVFDELLDILPYQSIVHSSGPYGMALLSRFPVDSSRTDAAGTASLPVLSAELETPVGRLCVIGVHPNAPFGSEESINRNLYLYQVGAMAQTRGMMCLLAGDFNAAPWSSGFEIIRNLPNLQPSIWRVPASWPASFGPLGVPLDHILLTMPFDKVRPIRMSKIWSGPHLPGSDHRPLITTLEVK